MASDLRTTLDLNDWLNTVAEHSIFRDFEKTDQFADIIDGLLGEIAVMTLDELAALRASGKYTEEAMDAIEELYELLINDEFALEYHLMSPSTENRFWVFSRDEFAVTQVSVYEVYDGVELVVVQNEEGEIELVDDFLPEKFDNYETVMVDQREVQDDDIVPMDTWEAIQQNGEYQMEGNFGDRSRIMAECRRIQRYYPEAPNAQKCRRLDHHYRNVMGHMIAWPIVLFSILFIAMMVRGFRARRNRRAPTESAKKEPLPATDLPPEYNFVIQFPPEYAEVTKPVSEEK